MTATPTLAATFRLFLRDKSLRDNTKRQYKRTLRRYLSDWMPMKITEITTNMVEMRYREIAGKAPPTANFLFTALSSILRFGFLYHEITTANPCTQLALFRVPTGTRRNDYIELSELPQWLEAVDQEVDRTLADLLLFYVLTGVRKNEALYLRYSDLDFDQRLICIGHPDRTAFRTKTNRPHTIPMSSFLYRMLRARRKRYPHRQFVFGSFRDKPRTKIDNVVRRIRNRSGVKFRIHDLRRTANNLLSHVSVSAPKLERKMLLNHLTEDGHARHYDTVNNEFLRLYVERLSRLVLSMHPTRKRQPVA